ncbi:MAG: hypothetical protein GY769_06810 [bacterium]|nr:hypothetical protein [bacterium]
MDHRGEAPLEWNSRAQRKARPGQARKQAYRSPRLEKYGDLRTFTLGGTPGAGDSGGGAFIENPLIP